MKAERNALSLADELRTLVAAAEGALLLLDGGTFTTIDADPEKAAKAMLAVLASRLRQLERVVRGAFDPEVLRGVHNSIEARALPGEDPDVRLIAASQNQKGQRRR